MSRNEHKQVIDLVRQKPDFFTQLAKNEIIQNNTKHDINLFIKRLLRHIMCVEAKWNSVRYFAARNLLECLGVEDDEEGMFFRMDVEHGAEQHTLKSQINNISEGKMGFYRRLLRFHQESERTQVRSRSALHGPYSTV